MTADTTYDGLVSSAQTSTSFMPTVQHHNDLVHPGSSGAAMSDDMNATLSTQYINMWPELEGVFSLLTSDLEPGLWTTRLLEADHALQPLLPLPDDSAGAATLQSTDSESSLTAHSRQVLSRMQWLVQDFSANLSRDATVPEVSADLMEMCLGYFFSEFLQTFPMLHEPTFSLRDSSPPLLLNMIATGSLFVAEEMGPAKAVGSALWNTAHAAVVTSWQRLATSEVTSNKDSVHVQLLLSTLIGQAYALLSGDPATRLAAQTSRGLDLYRAMIVGSSDAIGHRPSSMHTEATRADWKAWAQREVQSRALLGHYILDGLASQLSGVPRTARHTINSMTVPCSDESFGATTLAAWRQTLTACGQTTTFRELLLELFSDDDSRAGFVQPWSHMTIPVVMEALQSMIAEGWGAGGPSVGLPSRGATSLALWRLYQHQVLSETRSTQHSLDLSIRWHTVSLSHVLDPCGLVQGLCSRYNVQQSLHKAEGFSRSRLFSLDTWARSRDARRALLHSTAVLLDMQQLTVRNTTSPQIPFAVYMAAMTLLAIFDALGAQRLYIPSKICWQTVSMHEEYLIPHPDLYAKTTKDFLDTEKYVLDGQGRETIARNILVDINLLRTFLRASPFGIAQEMCLTLDQIVSARMARSR